MGKIKKIIGAFVHAPERFDELANRIVNLSRNLEEQTAMVQYRFDEAGEQIQTVENGISDIEKQIDGRDIHHFMDRICDDRELLSQLNRGLSIAPTVWGDPGRLDIDETASVFTCFFNTNSGRIRIGESTFAGSGVSILAGNHDPQLTGFLRRDNKDAEGCDIEIGRGVWLASGSTVLGPCRIGDNAVIAAGAVVTPGSTIPANEIWGGVPARKIGEIEGKAMTPDNPAVKKAFSRSNGILFTDGWGEQISGIFELPGHWLYKMTAGIITDKAEWKLKYRREGLGENRIRLNGPAGQEEIILTAGEGEMTIILPVSEGIPGEVCLTKEKDEKIFMAWFRTDNAEETVIAAPETGADRKEQTEKEQNPEGTRLDIEKIMEEIKAEARRWEPCEDLPAFERMPKEDLRKGEKLRAQVKELTDDYVIPQSFDYPSRNPLKNLYKKMAKKAMRCVVAPMSERVTDTNLRLKTALEKAVEVIEEQEKRIAELEKKAE